MDYTQYIQRAIAYIEQNLCGELSLDEIAKVSGFSKYYFLRIFKNQTGTGLFDYIQIRRLSSAAKLLLMSDMPILAIALRYRFESQESFTRAFKRGYALPPGQYRKAMCRLIPLKETDAMIDKETIKGWIVTGTAAGKYKAELDFTTFLKGTKSVHLKSTEKEYEKDEFATVMQQFRAKNFLGKRARFSGFVKSRDIKDWGGLWMRIDNTSGVPIKLDNMQNRPIKGDADWNHYSVVLDVPENSAILNIGVLLVGAGELWVDNTRFETVDSHVPTTDMDVSSQLPEMPANLSFEE